MRIPWRTYRSCYRASNLLAIHCKHDRFCSQVQVAMYRMQMLLHLRHLWQRCKYSQFRSLFCRTSVKKKNNALYSLPRGQKYFSIKRIDCKKKINITLDICRARLLHLSIKKFFFEKKIILLSEKSTLRILFRHLWELEKKCVECENSEKRRSLLCAFRNLDLLNIDGLGIIGSIAVLWRLWSRISHVLSGPTSRITSRGIMVLPSMHSRISSPWLNPTLIDKSRSYLPSLWRSGYLIRRIRRVFTSSHFIL